MDDLRNFSRDFFDGDHQPDPKLDNPKVLINLVTLQRFEQTAAQFFPANVHPALYVFPFLLNPKLRMARCVAQSPYQLYAYPCAAVGKTDEEAIINLTTIMQQQLDRMTE